MGKEGATFCLVLRIWEFKVLVEHPSGRPEGSWMYSLGLRRAVWIRSRGVEDINV